MYTTQLAAISQDPWFSRVAHPEFADWAALDLDPPDGVPFARVLEVARWIRDELGALGAFGAPKTSGADGLHVYIPLPPGTPYEAGLLYCQIIATLVAHKHPKAATTERAVRARGARVYIDCLQNILGRRWPAPTARAPAITRVYRHRSRGVKSTRGSTAASSRSGAFHRDWQRLAICGPR
jgi:bifunctional non-homologous end joining protein LigD